MIRSLHVTTDADIIALMDPTHVALIYPSDFIDPAVLTVVRDPKIVGSKDAISISVLDSHGGEKGFEDAYQQALAGGAAVIITGYSEHDAAEACTRGKVDSVPVILVRASESCEGASGVVSVGPSQAEERNFVADFAHHDLVAVANEPASAGEWRCPDSLRVDHSFYPFTQWSKQHSLALFVEPLCASKVMTEIAAWAPAWHPKLVFGLNSFASADRASDFDRTLVTFKNTPPNIAPLASLTRDAISVASAIVHPVLARPTIRNQAATRMELLSRLDAISVALLTTPQTSPKSGRFSPEFTTIALPKKREK
jgi:hypothetical protein